MKRILKIFSPILIAIVVGYIFGIGMFNQYNDTLVAYNADVEKVYFFQQGAYSTYESMLESTKLIENFVYLEEDGLFKVFISITKLEENKEKLIDYYAKKEVDIIVKEYKLNDSEFLTKLNNFDQSLLILNDTNAIETIIKQVLNVYKESSEN